MDLRNALMTIAYGPKGKDFKAALTAHMDGALGHFTKLDGFCKGPYMCGAKPQSADFHVFEMVDQHVAMAKEMGVAFELKASFPKLFQLHMRLKTDPALAGYFASPGYAAYATNNAMYTNYCGTPPPSARAPTPLRRARRVADA